MLNRSASLAMSTTSILKTLPCELDIKRHSPSVLYISTSLEMSTCVLKALPCKIDIKRHSPSILYVLVILTCFKKGQQPRPSEDLNIFTGQIFTLDSAVGNTSSHGGFLMLAMYHHRETIKSNKHTRKFLLTRRQSELRTTSS